MSLSSIEEEARSIIKSAELKAEEILTNAKRESEEILRREVVVELPQEALRALELEYLTRLHEIRERYEARVRKLKEMYAMIKHELIDEYLRKVLGL